MHLQDLVPVAAVLHEGKLAGRVEAGMHVAGQRQARFLEGVGNEVVAAEVGRCASVGIGGDRLVDDAPAGDHLMVDRCTVGTRRRRWTKMVDLPAPEIHCPHSRTASRVVDEQRPFIDEQQMMEMKVGFDDGSHPPTRGIENR